jgi:hypothetical protein
LRKSGFQGYSVDTNNSSTHENWIKNPLVVSAASISSVGVIWKNSAIIIEKTIEIALDPISCGAMSMESLALETEAHLWLEKNACTSSFGSHSAR